MVEEPDPRIVLVLLERDCGRVGRGVVSRGVSSAWKKTRPRRGSDLGGKRTGRERPARTRAGESGEWRSALARVPAKELVTSRRPLRHSPRSTPTTRLFSESSCFRRSGGQQSGQRRTRRGGDAGTAGGRRAIALSGSRRAVIAHLLDAAEVIHHGEQHERVHDDLVVRPLGDRRHRLRRVGHHVQRGGYPPGGIRTGARWRTLNVDAVSRADAFVREGSRSPGTSALGATRCEDGGAIAAPNGLESETPRSNLARTRIDRSRAARVGFDLGESWCALRRRACPRADAEHTFPTSRPHEGISRVFVKPRDGSPRLLPMAIGEVPPHHQRRDRG